MPVFVLKRQLHLESSNEMTVPSIRFLEGGLWSEILYLIIPMRTCSCNTTRPRAHQLLVSSATTSSGVLDFSQNIKSSYLAFNSSKPGPYSCLSLNREQFDQAKNKYKAR